MFELHIRTDNDAFHDPNNGFTETARILREIADSVERGASAGACRDINGNTVGRFLFAPDHDQEG